MLATRLLNDITFLILVFAFYSFAGWILETGYRSLKQHHFVNPGLLKGPFLPIYGLFALIVILTNQIWPHTSWGLAFVLFIFLSTVIEYLAGTLLERFFNLQLWSYHDTPLNFKGRVALPFSLLWGGLGLVFNYYLHPHVGLVFLQIPLAFKILLVIIFTIYFVIDLVYSTILLHQIDIFLRFENKMNGHLKMPNLHSVRVSFRRLISTYPKIRHTLTESVSFIQEKQAALQHLKEESFNKLRQMKNDR